MRVLDAFCHMSGTPLEDLPPVRKSAATDRNARAAEDAAFDHERGVIALNWLRVHAADWITLAGVGGNVAGDLADGKLDEIQDRASALPPAEPGDADPVDVHAVWDLLAPIRAGMEAAARAAGLSPDLFVDAAKFGAQLCAARACILDRELASLLPEVLMTAAHAAVYEMATGEPEPEPEPEAPLGDLDPAFDVTDLEVDRG